MNFLFAIKLSSVVCLQGANIYTESLYLFHCSCRPDTSQPVVKEATVIKKKRMIIESTWEYANDLVTNFSSNRREQEIKNKHVLLQGIR